MIVENVIATPIFCDDGRRFTLLLDNEPCLDVQCRAKISWSLKSVDAHGLDGVDELDREGRLLQVSPILSKAAAYNYGGVKPSQGTCE